MTTLVFAIAAARRSRASGHGDDADVRVDGAERIVGRLGFAGAGDGVEESGLADVRQSDDSGSEHMDTAGARSRAEPALQDIAATDGCAGPVARTVRVIF